MTTRKFRQLQLVPGPEEFNYQHPNAVILRMAWSIVLLPVEKFDDAINAIEIEARRIVGMPENMILFIEFLRRQWLPIAAKISVHDDVGRMNMLTELMNGQLLRRLGGTHPPLMVFIGKNVLQSRLIINFLWKNILILLCVLPLQEKCGVPLMRCRKSTIAFRQEIYYRLIDRQDS